MGTPRGRDVTARQRHDFVAYVCRAHSWHKHLSLVDGGTFVVFLADDAGAGYDEAVPRLHHGWKTTEEYRRAYGFLDVQWRTAPDRPERRDGLGSVRRLDDEHLVLRRIADGDDRDGERLLRADGDADLRGIVEPRVGVEARDLLAQLLHARVRGVGDAVPLDPLEREAQRRGIGRHRRLAETEVDRGGALLAVDLADHRRRDAGEARVHRASLCVAICCRSARIAWWCAASAAIEIDSRA